MDWVYGSWWDGGSVKWEGGCGLDWVYGMWWDGEVSNGRVCVVGLGVRKVVGWGKCQMGGWV